MMITKKYIAGYDYGMGGLYCFIYAKSKSLILDKYPELIIVDSLPEHFTNSKIETIKKKFTYDIDDEPKGVLEAIIKTRDKS